MICKWNLKIHTLGLIIIIHLRFRKQGITNWWLSSFFVCRLIWELNIGMGPPPTGSRDHLKIEKDGRLINRAPAPDLPGRDGRGGEDSRHSGRSSGQAELLNGSSQPHSAGSYQTVQKWQTSNCRTLKFCYATDLWLGLTIRNVS